MRFIDLIIIIIIIIYRVNDDRFNYLLLSISCYIQRVIMLSWLLHKGGVDENLFVVCSTTMA